MKKLIGGLICLILATLSPAQNIIQFTGGNYIYAENGKLTFNLDIDLFEARNWQYDAATDAYITTFRTSLPLRTRYTSDFVLYTARQQSPYQYAVYHNNPHQHNYINDGHYQKVFLPAVGWGLRVGGSIARNLLPPLITKCLTNTTCNVVGGVVSAHLCGINYFAGLINLPGGVCSKAEEDGFKKEQDGQYIRHMRYNVTCVGGVCHIGSKLGGFGNYAAAVSAAKAQCGGSVSTPMGPATGSGSRIENGNVECLYTLSSNPNNHYSAVWSIGGQKVKETLQIIDLSRYVAEDIKDNPNQYINDKSDLGKEIRKQTQITQAGLLSSSDNGTFSVIGSDPYRNPETGKTVQDVVTIGSAKPNNGSVASGNASEHTSGISSITNNVSVTHIDRGDVEADAPVGKPNKPNGNTGSNSANTSHNNNSGSSQKPNGNEEDKENGHCLPGDKTVGCMPVGDLPANTDISLPNIETPDFSLSIDSFLPSDGVCPIPLSLNPGPYSVNIDFEPMCLLALKIRMIVELIGALTAAFIIFRSNL